MIYFDNEKNAYGYEIENPICIIEDSLWSEYAGTDKWDIVDGEFTDITDTEEYKEKQAQQEKEQFKRNFFNTSLGWVRRKVSMATGETKDFLSDLLPTISMGVQMGQPVSIITYNEPDFTTDEIDWVALQEVKTVTAQFVQECFLQLSNDFKPSVDNSEPTINENLTVEDVTDGEVVDNLEE